MKKKVLTIIIIVAILASSLVAFSVVYAYELKDVFLTRDEWDSFESSMNEILPNIEQKKQESIQHEVGYQMYRRDILSREILQSMASDPAESSRLIEWSSRRAKELEDMTSVAPPSP